MPLPERFELEDILEDPQLRLVIEGQPGAEPTVVIEIQLGRDWIARHNISREKGVWMLSAAHDFVPRRDTPEPLTARLKRKATVHPHLPRIERLLEDALVLDRKLDPAMPPWWERLVLDWDMSKLRSPRGRATKINPREIERMLEEGLTYRQIADRLGVHRQSVYRAISTDRKRRTL